MCDYIPGLRIWACSIVVPMSTNVYIDGFNLYYGVLKGTAHRWLDLEKMCQVYLPGHTINRIRYFTAKVTPTPNDPDIGNRQQVYLRALRTLPSVSIHEGHFLRHNVRMAHAYPPPNTVEVIKTEEKGSDVNLATYLLADAFRNDASRFVVVTSDSDFLAPLTLVRKELGKDVGILKPSARPSHGLNRCSPSFTKTIRKGALTACQLPDPVVCMDGTRLSKPSTW